MRGINSFFLNGPRRRLGDPAVAAPFAAWLFRRRTTE
jgi:hypothetical protein